MARRGNYMAGMGSMAGMPKGKKRRSPQNYETAGMVASAAAKARGMRSAGTGPTVRMGKTGTMGPRRSNLRVSTKKTGRGYQSWFGAPGAE